MPRSPSGAADAARLPDPLALSQDPIVQHPTAPRLLRALLFGVALWPPAHAARAQTPEPTAESAPPPAAIPTLVISAGRRGGGYWGVADRLRQTAETRGLDVEVMESAGSTENLRRLEDPDSPVSLALAQSDALKHYLTEHPGFESNFEVLESIGKECVFLIAGKTSALENTDDLLERDQARLAIRSRESGVAVTFAYMGVLDPAFTRIQPVFMDPMTALDRIAESAADAPDAVMLVQRPKVRSPEIRRALAATETYRFVHIEDKDLADRLPGGQAVYSFLDLPLVRSKGWNTGLAVKTICTEGLLLGSTDKIEPEARKGLQYILDFQWMSVYPSGI